MSYTMASWPPTLACEPAILGYLQDTNQIQKSRDQGRSFSLGGKKYYLFGDTFCFDKTGNAICVSNTFALVKDKTQPLQSTYLKVNDNGVMEPLLKLTDSEVQYQNSTPGERYTLWPFSGVIEIANGLGLLWYEKGLEHKPSGQPQSHETLGIGLAQITIDPTTGQPVATRNDTLIFSEPEPRFGSVSTFLQDNFVYLYGIIPGSCNIALARVPILFAADARLYEYWDGTSWTTDKSKTPATVFTDLPQGAVIRSTLFGPDKPYVFIGVSKWADSQIRVGAAPTLQGPWDIRAVGKANGYKQKDGFTYCIYPHPWVAQDGPTSLFITWSEQWPGGVVAARITFQTKSSGGKNEL